MTLVITGVKAKVWLGRFAQGSAEFGNLMPAVTRGERRGDQEGELHVGPIRLPSGFVYRTNRLGNLSPGQRGP